MALLRIFNKRYRHSRISVLAGHVNPMFELDLSVGIEGGQKRVVLAMSTLKLQSAQTESVLYDQLFFNPSPSSLSLSLSLSPFPTLLVIVPGDPASTSSTK